jgi:hypothetical protein
MRRNNAVEWESRWRSWCSLVIDMRNYITMWISAAPLFSISIPFNLKLNRCPDLMGSTPRIKI